MRESSFTKSFISIHALREEGDSNSRGGTIIASHFNPRPPRGGRLLNLGERVSDLEISIHALREEGDHRYNRPYY